MIYSRLSSPEIYPEDVVTMKVTSKNNDDTMMASLASDILNYLFSPAGNERLKEILREIDRKEA